MSYGAHRAPIGVTSARVLDYIRAQETPPTFREIGDAVGLSSLASVAYHVARLRETGLVRSLPDYTPNRKRYLVSA